ncbi:MAG: pyrroloquinoline quinone biosynthesis peptide chaperone PqqD [Xanthomonadaceae bacterium]|nr:pyrroloquinoline quinone biosynthesis peptide chaperone PqqD [Xanthomonadaceae bacterium]
MSATDIRDSDSPAIARGFRLQWEPAQSAHVLLYPEGMVKLNGSAGEILRRCDGVATLAEIVSDLEGAFSRSGLRADVVAFLTLAAERGWVAFRGRDEQAGAIGDGGE